MVGLLDSLDQQIQNARRVPLTTQVRLDKAEMQATLDEIRKEPADARTLPLIDELDEAIRGARPVPLTDQVRVEGDEVRGIIQRIRANITADRDAEN